ncbi:rhodanese-like domain-containing protein [Gramella sp. MAR_2010_147]|uniref:rhodanese-like domain-containing protein n=1 Tax=Gramella sp. MAR_2010_147 TaxID=1250205 RepID=UPI000B7D16E0|nr:rhodanese-like domain-containing protein [Gramella sp. MAR_2010_147]
MKNLLSLILIIFGCSIVSGQNEPLDKLLSKYNKTDVPYISVEELKMNRLKDSVVILDAREKIEYDVSHLPEAIFVGYSNFSEDQFSQKFKDKSAPIVVYCSIGIRSENIGNKLQKAGYTNVSNLYGGIFAWKNTGFEVFSNGKETNKVHTFSRNWAKYLEKGEKIY